MKVEEFKKFTLENFEGPLDFLLCLIQRHEINIHEVPLYDILQQFLKKIEEDSLDVDSGAEFIGHASFLIWLKSKMLLPRHEQEADPELQELDPKFEIIHKLLEYCRFKEAGKGLNERYEKQSAYFPRGAHPPPVPDMPEALGIEHISLEAFVSLFKTALDKAKAASGTIQEEVWRISDKLRLVRFKLKEHQKIDASLLFSHDMSKAELIVTFLAVLELMKSGEVLVMVVEDKVFIFPNEGDVKNV